MTKMPEQQFKDHGFVVLAERCDQCLYGKDKLVSNERRKEIVQGLRSDDGYFICHKASMTGRAAACAGDYEHRQCGQMGQVMTRLGCVTRMPEAELNTLPIAEQDDADQNY
jgi:RecB family endonuclease NucS